MVDMGNNGEITDTASRFVELVGRRLSGTGRVGGRKGPEEPLTRQPPTRAMETVAWKCCGKSCGPYPKNWGHPQQTVRGVRPLVPVSACCWARRFLYKFEQTASKFGQLPITSAAVQDLRLGFPSGLFQG